MLLYVRIKSKIIINHLPTQGSYIIQKGKVRPTTKTQKEKVINTNPLIKLSFFFYVICDLLLYKKKQYILTQ